jgi:CheY-like chemotaxis protein
MKAQSEGKTRQEFRVLVVDDNQDAADTFSWILERWGYDVRVAYDGVNGLETAIRHRPHCLFMDIGMPRMTGYELARQVRSQPGLDRAKLIALTAYSDENHLRLAEEAGFDYHLVKPADLADVERLLTMLQDVFKLVEKTEELAQQSLSLAGETKELLEEVREDIREVKEEVQELKQEIREVKEEMRKDNDE